MLTHSLVEMIQEGGKQFDWLIPLLTQARELDLHYIPSRYPNGLPSGYPHAFYDRGIAEAAAAAADRIITAVSAYYQSVGASDISKDASES